MRKVSYEVVAITVDKLYQKEFPVTALESIEEHCLFIRSYIEACGWEIEDFIRWNFHGQNPDLQWN
jgi:hypothetical protein